MYTVWLLTIVTSVTALVCMGLAILAIGALLGRYPAMIDWSWAAGNLASVPAGGVVRGRGQRPAAVPGTHILSP